MPIVPSCFSLRPRSRCRRIFALVFLAPLFAAAGCGGTPSYGDRMPLEGTVTVNGAPLDVKGTIYFNPTKGQPGIGSSGQVLDGKFTIPAESGPSPGQTLEVIVITAPGIPPDGTPKEQMKLPQTLKATVTLPKREDKEQKVQIAF